jgi:hypothetical protein
MLITMCLGQQLCKKTMIWLMVDVCLFFNLITFELSLSIYVCISKVEFATTYVLRLVCMLLS